MDDLMEKMLKKKGKPLLTITIGQADEDEAGQETDLAPDRKQQPELNDEDDAQEADHLRALLGDEAEGDEEMKTPDRPLGIGEMARAKMKKRLIAIKK